MIEIVKIHPDAKLPFRGSASAAGLDLYSITSAVIPPGTRALLHTGITMAMPEGFVGLIWPRSKLANTYGATVLAGVVDSDYRGEVMISLLNTGKDEMEVNVGDKVAQMIMQQHFSDMKIVEVGNLSETVRGVDGINSFDMRLR